MASTTAGVWSEWVTVSSTTTTNSTADVWDYWCDDATTVSGTAAGMADTWSTWCSNTATTTTTTRIITNPSRVWVRWISASGDSSHEEMIVPRTRELTPEQLAEERAQQEERDRQALARAAGDAKRYRAAKERAEGFLYEHLTDAQRAQLKRDKFFVVQGGKSGKSYRVRADGSSYTGNITELDETGREVKRFCAHLEHAANAPAFDHYLAQKLMLEHCEEEYLRVANASNIR